MYLTFGRHIDNNVIDKFGVTTQSAAGGQRSFALTKFNLGSRDGRQVLVTRGHAVFGERASHAANLATTAETATAADRIDVDP